MKLKIALNKPTRCGECELFSPKALTAHEGPGICEKYQVDVRGYEKTCEFRKTTNDQLLLGSIEAAYQKWNRRTHNDKFKKNRHPRKPMRDVQRNLFD